MRATAFRAPVPIDRAALAELVVGGEHHQISGAGSPFPCLSSAPVAAARGLGSDSAVSGWNDSSALSALKDRSEAPVALRQRAEGLHVLTAAGTLDPG
jgi:hypothetical protein